MKLKNLSYKAQIFLASLILITIPSFLIVTFAIRKNAVTLADDYRKSQETIVSQACMTIDTLLADSLKIAHMPLLNPDMERAMHTDYGSDYLAYAQDSALFRDQFLQSNRLNQNLTSCIFMNRSGYTFEYNIHSVTHQKQMMENIEKWSDIARQTPGYTYFGPLQQTPVFSSGNVLPMIKILLDGTTFEEIGVCYTEINFKSVEKIFMAAQNSDTITLIYDSDGILNYISDESLLDDQQDSDSLLTALSQFNQTLTDIDTPHTETLHIGKKHWMGIGCCNQTTGWHLIQISDNYAITDIYKNSFYSYLLTLATSFLIGLVLALFLSSKLTSSISRLCREIDNCDTDHYVAISMDACGSNQELCKLISSFNNLNLRLSRSLEQNYRIRLQEHQTRIQMLQFQINHHFLHNTLNVIKSLANINNIPEIETIAVCMSDLIRYNLSSFPTALLRDELAQVERYMTIQNIRFTGRFQFECTIPDGFRNMEVPVFILQPFIENSVEHGFSMREKDCRIDISCFLDQKTLHLFVADNGSGMSAEALDRLRENLDRQYTCEDFSQVHSLGIRNVHQRIQSTYGSAYGVSIESQPGEGTLVDISLPFS